MAVPLALSPVQRNTPTPRVLTAQPAQRTSGLTEPLLRPSSEAGLPRPIGRHVVRMQSNGDVSELRGKLSSRSLAEKCYEVMTTASPALGSARIMPVAQDIPQSLPSSRSAGVLGVYSGGSSSPQVALTAQQMKMQLTSPVAIQTVPKKAVSSSALPSPQRIEQTTPVSPPSRGAAPSPPQSFLQKPPMQQPSVAAVRVSGGEPVGRHTVAPTTGSYFSSIDQVGSSARPSGGDISMKLFTSLSTASSSLSGLRPVSTQPAEFSGAAMRLPEIEKLQAQLDNDGASLPESEALTQLLDSPARLLPPDDFPSLVQTASSPSKQLGQVVLDVESPPAVSPPRNIITLNDTPSPVRDPASVAPTSSAESPSIIENGVKKDMGTNAQKPTSPASSGLIMESHLEANESADAHNFDIVLVLPMPSTATEAEDARFTARFLTGHRRHTYDEVIRHAVVSPALRNSMKISNLQNLGDARNCVVELLQSFFATLGASLHAGAEMYRFSSEDGEQLFICIKVSNHLAESLAEMGEYPLQLSKESVTSADSSLHIKISDASTVIPAYVNYDQQVKQLDVLETFFDPFHPGKSSHLRSVDKVRLLYNKITDYIDLHELERLGFLSSFFPDHNKAELMPLRDRWAVFAICKMLHPSQPIDEIRDYFGEAIGFYFLFLGFLARGLLYLMPMAFITSALWIFGHPDIGQLLFCISLIIWSTILNKCWRREESYYANKWGMDRHFHTSIKEMLNPRFHGTKSPSPVDENIMILQPDPWKRKFGILFSITISILYTLLAVYAVLLNRSWVNGMDAKYGHTSIYGRCGALALSFQMQAFDKMWDKLLVTFLNDMEQHITVYAADQSRALKTFVIKSFNAFFPFIYLAYIQPISDPAGCMGDCRDYLRNNLLIVFMTYIAFGVVDIVYPLAALKFRIWREERHAKSHGHDVFKQSLLEEQVMMNAYTGQDQRDDYLAVIFPVAFVMMFATMLPSMVFLAFLSLASQIRTHAWKLSGATRRSFPTRAEGIGLWDSLMSLISYVAIFNCIALLVFQVDYVGRLIPGFHHIVVALGLKEDSMAAKLLLFFFLENTAIVFKLAIDQAIPNVTAKTRLEQHRQEVQRSRLHETNHAEFHEEISLVCPGDQEARKVTEALPPLRPGHELYVEPFV